MEPTREKIAVKLHVLASKGALPFTSEETQLIHSCLIDTKVKEQPLGPDGRPLPGWYYDSDGVCRPNKAMTDEERKPGPDDFVYRNPAPNASAPHVPSRSKVFEISAALAQSGEPPMTDEELQQLCKMLRDMAAPSAFREPIKACGKAADELERLSALAQSDAKRIVELEAECGRFENELFEARERLRYFDEQQIQFSGGPHMR